MAWIKVPPEHHPLFHAALPHDLRVETMKMFGGLAAKVNGHIFAGLFGRSTVLALPEPLKSRALALEGAGPFDPMGDGRAMSDKIMLPESMMEDPAELRHWIGLAFEAMAALPPKPPKPDKKTKATTATKQTKPTKTPASRAEEAATPKASASTARRAGGAAKRAAAAKAPAKASQKKAARSNGKNIAAQRAQPGTRTSKPGKPGRR